MRRKELEEYITGTYGPEAEYPWAGHPGFAVFRHENNKKWFALVMDVPKEKLGLPGEGALDIVNLKCDPMAIGSFRAEPGVYPAYHMSKASWVSAALDGSAADETIRTLLDGSFALTALKMKKRKG